MPKSMPSPTNNGMNATEIKLKRPTIASPSAAVTTNPAAVVARIAPIIAADRVAIHSSAVTAASIATPIITAPSPRLANSSSASGTGPGQADADAVRGIEPPLYGDRPQRRARRRAGLDVGIVEPGLQRDEAAQAARVGGAVEQRAPGETCRLPGGGAGQRGVERGDRQRVEARLAPRHTIERHREPVHDAAQRRVGGKGCQEGLRLDQPVGGRLHLGDRQHEKPEAVEEWPAVGPPDVAEAGIGRQCLREARRRAFGDLRCRTVDDDRGQVGGCRKSAVEHRLVAPERQVARN